MDSNYRNNHYVPQWYQKKFLSNELKENKFFYLDLKPKKIPETNKYRKDILRWGTKKCFSKNDLYTYDSNLGSNRDIEKYFFGKIDRNGKKSLEYFENFEHPSAHQDALESFLNYMSLQKLRTPKGLYWLSALSKYNNKNLDLLLMQRIQNMHCALWSECVWQIADASYSKTKFLLSDHPVTTYNRACFPQSKWCEGFNSPDIRYSGTHTIFPLSSNKILILTNLSWVRNPYKSELEERPNSELFRNTIFNYMDIQTHRFLTEKEVLQINYVIKNSAFQYVAAEKKEWLYPEKNLKEKFWRKLGKGYLFMPDPRSLNMGGEIMIGYKNGSTDAFSEYGHKPWQQGFNDEKRFKTESKNLEKFKGEFALMHGPKRRGRSYQFGKLEKEEDSEDFHKYHLEKYKT